MSKKVWSQIAGGLSLLSVLVVLTMLFVWIAIVESHASETAMLGYRDKPINAQFHVPSRDLDSLGHTTDIAPTMTFTVWLPMTSRTPPPIHPFLGYWTNENPDTRGITHAEIRTESNTVYVHMWGKCHPTDCDWGETTTDPSDANDGVLSLTWVLSFKVETQQLIVLTDGRLQVIGHVHYTDDSGRPNRDYTEYYIEQ